MPGLFGGTHARIHRLLQPGPGAAGRSVATLALAIQAIAAASPAAAADAPPHPGVRGAIAGTSSARHAGSRPAAPARGTGMRPAGGARAPRNPRGAEGALGLLFQVYGSLGYTAAGVAMRNLGYGTINIAGVPTGATIQSATLIWDVVADQDLYDYRLGNFDGVPVTGEAEYIGNTPCWPPAENQSFEADVTPLVSGNGSYQLSGFASGEADGADPWLDGSQPPLLEGASLVVIYRLASLPRTSVQIDMGAFMSTAGQPASAIITGFQAAASHAAKTTYIVADGQETGNTATFDDTDLPDVGFPGGDPQAVPDYSMGNLWDTVTVDVSSLVQPGDGDATASITGYDDCIVWVGQVLAVQMPAQIQVGAVRFAPFGQSAPGTPGLPVIKDDVSPVVNDDDYGPTSCDGLADPRDYDWLDCTFPSIGSPDKIWPVIYAGGQQLTVGQAVFFAGSPPQNPMVTATAYVGGATLTLPAAKLSTQPAGNGLYQLTASNLTFTGSLPAQPGLDPLEIDWTVTDGGVPVTANRTLDSVFVTAAPYATLPKGTQAEPPYLTLLAMGADAASDLTTTPKELFQAIVAELADRDFLHPVLDAATGNISNGPAITYYENGYKTIADWFNKPLTTCPSTVTALTTDDAHCGNWAIFLANALAYQGITASYVDLGASRYHFYLGPNPAAGDKAYDYAYMLIDPDLWSFTGRNAEGPYPYYDSISVGNGKMKVGGEGDDHVIYTPSRTAIAQGLIHTPPEMFYTGDHAIVETKWGYVDPSYGTPQDDDPPFASIADYEQEAIAGFAVIFIRKDGKFEPLRLTDSAITECAKHDCQFRAVPFDRPAT